LFGNRLVEGEIWSKLKSQERAFWGPALSGLLGVTANVMGVSYCKLMSVRSSFRKIGEKSLLSFPEKTGLWPLTGARGKTAKPLFQLRMAEKGGGESRKFVRAPTAKCTKGGKPLRERSQSLPKKKGTTGSAKKGKKSNRASSICPPWGGRKKADTRHDREKTGEASGVKRELEEKKMNFLNLLKMGHLPFADGKEFHAERSSLRFKGKSREKGRFFVSIGI